MRTAGKHSIVLGVLLLALLGIAGSAQGADPSNCPGPNKVWSHDPGTQAIDELRGPALANVWVNQGLIPSDGPWRVRSKNPGWGQALVKVRIDRGIEVNLFWAGGHFQVYPRTAACQAKMVQDFNAVSEPAKSLDDLRQWGIGLYFHVGNS